MNLERDEIETGRHQLYRQTWILARLLINFVTGLEASMRQMKRGKFEVLAYSVNFVELEGGIQLVDNSDMRIRTVDRFLS